MQEAVPPTGPVPAVAPGPPALAPSPGGIVRLTDADGIAALDALAPVWDRLVAAVPRPLPHFSHAWVAAWFAHRLARDEGWTLLAAKEGDRFTAVLPLARGPHPRLGRAATVFRVPFDDHCWAGDALVDPASPNALASLLAELKRSRPHPFSVTFPLVREGSPTLAALRSLDGFAVVEHDAGLGSFARIEGGMERFRASLPDQFRRNLRKANNRFAKEPGASVRFVPAANSSPEDLDRFLAIEASGWKGRAGTAITADPHLLAFYKDLVPRLAAAGWLEWHVLTIGGETAAVHFAARLGRSLTLLKIAYDERFSRLSPGNLLFERTVERAFAAGDVDEVNCLTDMPWHRNWSLPQVRYRHVRVFPHRALPLLCGWAPAFGRAAVKASPALSRLACAVTGRRRDKA